MKIALHPSDKGNLSKFYREAFNNAVDLFIVMAYLTDWDSKLSLNSNCRSFRLIVGKDFGITRKEACRDVMRWLPSKKKGQFMVADSISGFHPKALFWKEQDGQCFAIIGSSNMTRAAFETNYEINVFQKLSESDFSRAKRWMREIEESSVIVSEDWLKSYKEAEPPKGGVGGGRRGQHQSGAVFTFKLPKPNGMNKIVRERREQMRAYNRKRVGLIDLFKKCARGKLSSAQFYKSLPDFWGWDLNNRLQGRGWERQGCSADFQALSESFLRIIAASDGDRDDMVSHEIDALCEQQNPARRAFLSEMLCLRFPEKYPVLNKPVKRYIAQSGFRPPYGASEGVKYVDLAKKLRHSIVHNPGYPAKNLAELDAIIWLAYGDK